MLTTGFFGTRADAFVDFAMVLLVLAPFLMAYAIRLAVQRRHRKHRNLQLAVLLAGILAILLLEGSIRFGNAQEAFAASGVTGPGRTVLFYGHVAIAVSTFIAWCALAVTSWRSFSRTLPGAFSQQHRRWGWFTFIGLVLTSGSGTALYVICFAL